MSMNTLFSAEQLADTLNEWCDEHGVVPATGQAGERMTVRNIRYYRTLGLLDPPEMGGQGFGEKHRLQLVAVRLLQAQGLPLQRIQELLFGRTPADLKRIEERGLAELPRRAASMFQPTGQESWCMTPLDDDFMLVSRRGRAIAPGVRDRLLDALREHRTGPARNRAAGRPVNDRGNEVS